MKCKKLKTEPNFNEIGGIAPGSAIEARQGQAAATMMKRAKIKR